MRRPYGYSLCRCRSTCDRQLPPNSNPPDYKPLESLWLKWVRVQAGPFVRLGFLRYFFFEVYLQVSQYIKKFCPSMGSMKYDYYSLLNKLRPFFPYITLLTTNKRLHGGLYLSFISLLYISTNMYLRNAFGGVYDEIPVNIWSIQCVSPRIKKWTVVVEIFTRLTPGCTFPASVGFLLTETTSRQWSRFCRPTAFLYIWMSLLLGEDLVLSVNYQLYFQVRVDMLITNEPKSFLLCF